MQAEKWQVLAEFEIVGRPGSDRAAAQRVAEHLRSTPLTGERLEKLKTGVAEAVLNAVEHGNQNRPELPVRLRIETGTMAVRVSVTDRGEGFSGTAGELPDLEAKLAGRQTTRGWGLMLMEEMIDEVRTRLEDGRHTVELLMRFREAANEL